MSAFNIPYIVGDGFQRDHQYWPTISPAEFATYYSPARTIPVDLSGIMALAWRVKRWKLTGNCAVNLQVNYSGYPAGEVTFIFNVPTLPDVITWTYADAAARLAATGFIPDDVGKFAYQTDDDTYWTLAAIIPTWEPSGMDVPVTWNKVAVFTATFGDDLLHCVAHGLSANDLITLSNEGGVLPGGLTASTYAVIASGLTADAFKVSTTIGGSAVNVTDNGSGTHVWSSGDIWDCVQEPDMISKAGISEHYKFGGLRNRGTYKAYNALPVSAALSGSSVSDYIALSGIANPYATFFPTSVAGNPTYPPDFSVNSRMELLIPSFGSGIGDEYVVSGSFYPIIKFGGGFQVPHASFDGGDLGVLAFSTQSLPVGGSGTLTIHPVISAEFDVPMTCGGSLSFFGFGSLDPDSTGACEFDLTAVEFWPFQNSLGEDVYDTATGAQINDPFG